MQSTIRSANATDAELLAELLEEIGEYYGTTSILPFSERLANVGRYALGEDPVATVLLATDQSRDGVCVGMAAYSIIWPAAGRTALYLKELFVRRPYRRQGIGRALMLRLTDIAAEQECLAMYWTSMSVESQGFYQAMGFTADDKRKFYQSTISSKPVEASGPTSRTAAAPSP